MSLTNTVQEEKQLSSAANSAGYSVEFFHIYTDEKINGIHEGSLHYLQEAKKAWNFNYKLIILIDDYNPDQHSLKTEEVMDFLQKKGELPDFWAYEGDLVSNANLLLEAITSPKIKKQYIKYIKDRQKYPCSLLTATWYLTRLGVLPYKGVINSTSEDAYEPAHRLINILPQDYKPVEIRALDIIEHSTFKVNRDKIQDLFFPSHTGRETSLW